MVIDNGAAALYGVNQLAGNFVPRERDHTLVAGSQSLLGGDPERVMWELVNFSANDLYISFTGEVSSTHGVLLSAHGGFVSSTVIEDFILPALPVYIYSAAGGEAIYTIEVRRQTKLTGA